jgi:capsular exopolysaccharide synthesis family protein
MALKEIWDILWQRRRLLCATLVLLIAIVVAVTEALPKSYKATATMFVGPTQAVSQATALDSSVGTALTHTYSALLPDPSVADRVAARLPFKLTRTQLLDKMSFAPVELTQLVQVTAEDNSPDRAATLANTYARVFVAHANREYAAGAEPTKISLAELSAPPTSPARPNPPLYIGLGSVLALFLAAGVVLAVHRLQDRIVPEEDAATLLGRSVIARIPVARDPWNVAARELADAFRLLRLNLDLAMIDHPQVIAVTSGGPGEGKTMIASHLAVTAAADGERVVLLDADLRRPGLTELADAAGNAQRRRGLTNYLLGNAELDAVVQQHPQFPGVDLIFAGVVTNPPKRRLTGSLRRKDGDARMETGQVLRSRRLGTLIGLLRGGYDRVVIDTSPVLLGPDASLLLAEADATLCVVDLGSSRRAQTVAGLNQIARTSAQLAGLVLNRVPMPSSYGYYERGGAPELAPDDVSV